jgi:hypothetical protein
MDHEFPEFSHAAAVWRDLQDRVRALEEANDLLLAFIDADLAMPWRPAAERLAKKLRKGVDNANDG